MQEYINEVYRYGTTDYTEDLDNTLKFFIEKGYNPFDKSMIKSFGTPYLIKIKDGCFVLSSNRLEKTTYYSDFDSKVILNYVKTLRVKLTYNNNEIEKIEFLDFIDNADDLKFKQKKSIKKKSIKKKSIKKKSIKKKSIKKKSIKKKSIKKKSIKKKSIKSV
jgi:hypothetical protein